MGHWAFVGVGLAAGVGLAVFANWRAGLPADPLRPRMIPWKFLIILAGFWCVLMVVHAANLLGVETGGRYR